MTKSLRALLVGAALTGFVAGTSANLMAQDTGGDKAAKSGKKATKSKKEKHACIGLYSCNAKGGCGTTNVKHDCKGKGECRTDGKPMAK